MEIFQEIPARPQINLDVRFGWSENTAWCKQKKLIDHGSLGNV